MRVFLVLMTLVSSVNALALDCQDLVLTRFIQSTLNYEHHEVSNKPVKHPAGTEGFESYGRYVELGYKFDVLSYTASNEYMSGFGAYEIIVEPATCIILKMKEVYSE